VGIFQVKLGERSPEIRSIAASSAEAAINQLRVPGDDRPLHVVFLTPAIIDKTEAARLARERHTSTEKPSKAS
jgi:hypothetical protein